MSSSSSQIEVDSDTSDYDYETSFNSSTASLTSSINEYIFGADGRRYHAYFGPEKNLLPTDEIEQDRLDMYHEIMLQLRSELHQSPLAEPHNILDVGTGTGIWAIDMADKYPMAQVIGIDLTPIQPKWVPPNCKFEVDDAEREWTFKPDYFDFIHARTVSHSIGDWPKLLSQAYICCKPGGFVELLEFEMATFCDDGTMADDNPMKVFFDLLAKALAKIGRPGVTTASLRKNLEDAGFVDINVIQTKQPIGAWPKNKRMKQIGVMTMVNGETAFNAYGYQSFTRILGMGHDEAEKICKDAVEAMSNRNYHLYFMNDVAYGRKPREDEC